VSNLKYYIIDTETNGILNVHECVEISIIRAIDKVQLSRNIICEHPELSSLDALQVTNKTMVDLLKGSPKEKVVAECNKFFAEDGLTSAHRCIVGHSIAFDKRFIHALWSKCGEKFPADLWLCTMALTRKYAKQIGIVKPKVNLTASCDLLGIKKVAGIHTAKGDVRNTYFLYKELVENKKIDHLSLIKTDIHYLNSNSQSEKYSMDDIGNIE